MTVKGTDILNCILIPSGQDMIETLLPHLEPDGGDYSGSMVIFPGKRPAHFLRKAIADKRKSGFIPPVIFSMDGFVDFVYQQTCGKAARYLETMDAVFMLYELHKKSPNPLGGNQFMEPDWFFPLGLRIYRDCEELHIERVNPFLIREVEQFAGEGLPERTAARLQSLSFFYEGFYRDIAACGFSTRSVRYRTVSDLIDRDILKGFRKIILAGFFALTQSEQLIFREMLSWQNTFFLFQDGPGMREKLSRLGINMKSHENVMKRPDMHFYSSSDTHGQVFALSHLLRKDIRDRIPVTEKTAVILPSSETLFPLLRQCLPVFSEEEYNISLGYPLHRTPVFGFLNNLMELVSSMDEDRVYLPDYLKFALHPYTKNILLNGSPEPSRILFHTIEEILTQQKTRTFMTLAEIEQNDAIFHAALDKSGGAGPDVTAETFKEHLATVHRNTILKFLGFENVHDFAIKCSELLNYIFTYSTARLHPLFYPYSSAFIRDLDALSRSLMKETAFREVSSYFILFRKYIMTCHVPFEGTPIQGMQVLGFLETRCLSFDRLFILDVNEEVLPDTRKEDTLLPLKAREILRLPTYRDRDRLTAYYFDALLNGSKEAHLFFVENDQKERSRFVERLLWEQQKKDRNTDERLYVKPVQYRINLGNSSPRAIPKNAHIESFLKGCSYSATVLDAYLNCQLQFYYTFVLGLDQKEEISGEVGRDDIGKFVHTALARYFEKKKGRRLKESDISLEEMDRLIDRLFEGEYGKNPSGALYLVKQQIKDHLKDFLRDYSIPLLKRHSRIILDVERSIHITRGGFALKGRLDCVEQRDDRINIIDYKTSSIPDYLEISFGKLDLRDRGTWEEAIRSLQLPFYLLLYSEVTGRAMRDLNGMFLLLGRTAINEKIELPLFDEADVTGEICTALETVIFKLLEEIVNPKLPFQPPRDLKKSCRYCTFRHICGTQWAG